MHRLVLHRSACGTRCALITRSWGCLAIFFCHVCSHYQGAWQTTSLHTYRCICSQAELAQLLADASRQQAAHPPPVPPPPEVLQALQELDRLFEQQQVTQSNMPSRSGAVLPVGMHMLHLAAGGVRHIATHVQRVI